MHRTIVSLLLWVIVGHGLGAQTTSADSAAVAALIRQHEAAMGAGDLETLRVEYAPMTLWINAVGVHRTGRDSIVSYLGRVFAESGAVRRRTGDSVSVSILGEAAAFARTSIERDTGRLDRRPATPGGHTDVMFMLSKADGGWTIQQELVADELPTSRALPVGASAGVAHLDPPTQSHCNALRYPKDLVQAGVAGRVRLGYVVGVNGHLEAGTVRVISSTNVAFNAPAIEAVESCSYKPARFFHIPVRQPVEQGVPFSPPGN